MLIFRRIIFAWSGARCDIENHVNEGRQGLKSQEQTQRAKDEMAGVHCHLHHDALSQIKHQA